MNGQSFLAEQMDFERVNSASEEKLDDLKNDFIAKGLSFPPEGIYLRAFKAQAQLELWVMEGEVYKLYETYKVCKNSGDLGPKKAQGDLQVPEGFYFIDRFNPVSSFHLSLGINYPNEADLMRTTAEDPGGDIFIHGKCCTIGCLPMTDEIIKEIYLLSTYAKDAGQEEIPVHIYPFQFNVLNEYIYFKQAKEWKPFWESLKEIDNYFVANRKLPTIDVNSSGEYFIVD